MARVDGLSRLEGKSAACTVKSYCPFSAPSVNAGLYNRPTNSTNRPMSV